MRASLSALTAELKRLKASGVKSLPVSDASLAQLRAALVGRSGPRTGPLPPPTVAAVVPEAPVPAKAPERTFTVKPSAAPALSIPAPVPLILPAGDKSTRWAALRTRVLADEFCRAQVRPGKQVVFGVGSLDAKIMFVGEAPGAEEEVQGEPFVGPAGPLLNKMIGAMGLKRADVYIVNIMNWRPQMPVDASGVQYGNRPPSPPELAYCLPYLHH